MVPCFYCTFRIPPQGKKFSQSRQLCKEGRSLDLKGNNCACLTESISNTPLFAHLILIVTIIIITFFWECLFLVIVSLCFVGVNSSNFKSQYNFPLPSPPPSIQKTDLSFWEHVDSSVVEKSVFCIIYVDVYVTTCANLFMTQWLCDFSRCFC